MFYLLVMQFSLGDGIQPPKQEPLPTLESLLVKISMSRINKMPYQLVIREEDFHTASPPAKTTTRHIWWDANHQRVDWYPTLSEYPPGSGYPIRTVQGINIEKSGYGIHYEEEENLIARFKPIENFEHKFNFIVNPVNFGHAFGGIWNDEKIDRLIAVFFSSPVDISWVPSNDGNVLKVSKINKLGYISELVVDPRRDYEIISISFKGEKIRESIRSKLKNWDGHWYPEQITYERWNDDKLLTRKEIWIRNATFKQPIPPDTFTLAGIKMLPRHTVRVDDKLGLMRVDEGKLVPFENKVTTSEPVPPPATMPVRVPEPGEWRFNPWLLAVGVTLALAAIVLIIRVIRGRSAKS